ncbi:DUF2207 domain-containing protein [Candidatus Peregrinibacteria bacterium]|nr:DUF2207 domain-containing protein [Candidatus Peregrinibacteria bacterium]
MLKKFFLSIFFSLILIPGFTIAQNYTDWVISDFDTRIKINQDSSINVTETIVADFSKARVDKRGIIRYIPIKYKDQFNNNFNVRFDLKSVTDEKGKAYEILEKRENDSVIIRVGNPNIYFREAKTYVINYEVKRTINTFQDHDELFWNSTGNGWDVPILNATTTVEIPEGANSSELMAKCFTGSTYSRAQECEFEIIDNQTIFYETTDELDSYEGLTIVAGFPTNLVDQPSVFTKFIWFIIDNWGYLIPILVFLFMYYIWYTKGRDPKALKDTIMPEYDVPDNLKPAELGALIDDSVDSRDITATIIDLAIRGYIKINETENKKTFFGSKYNYTLEKIPNKKSSLLNNYEKTIYEGIFSGSKSKIDIKDLKYKFYKNIPKIKTTIYKDLIARKYLALNPEKTKETYFVIAGTVFFLVITFLNFLAAFQLSIFIGLLLSAVVIAAFAPFMPKKTQKGADVLIRIKGFEEFIATAEKDRIRFYEQENIFEKVLPYAIALNLGEKWSEACKDLYKENPDWYNSNRSGFSRGFNTYYFMNALDSFNNNFTTNMTAAPRSTSASSGYSGFSSGGGFSGGGFGGGGGSSW